MQLFAGFCLVWVVKVVFYENHSTSTFGAYLVFLNVVL